MIKLFKIVTASLLTATLGVTTVVCCCIGPAVMAHFQKTAVCSHCLPQDSSQGHSSKASDSCMYHLTNAEISHGQITISAAPVVFVPQAFFYKHIATVFLPSLVLAYPRGSPLSTPSFTPLYLRTFNLRV